MNIHMLFRPSAWIAGWVVGLMLTVCLLAAPAGAADYTIVFQDGAVRTGAKHLGYNEDSQQLEVKYNGKNRKIELTRLASIARDGVEPPAGPDSLDTVILTSGKVLEGYFLYWTSKNFAFAVAGPVLPLKVKANPNEIAAIRFGARVSSKSRHQPPSPDNARFVLHFTDGQVRDAATHRGFEARKQLLKMRYKGKNRDLDISDISSVSLEGVTPPTGPDTLDTVLLRNGEIHRGYFFYWTTKNFALGVPGSLSQKIKIAPADIAAVRFGPKVLMADRWDWISDFANENPQEEIALGAQYAEQLTQEMFLVQDPALQQYIQELGERLVVHSKRTNLDYKFHIINDNVVNAFAVPGGFIYFYRGLIEMTENEEELAGVMAHEIGHIVGRHSMQQMQNTKKLGWLSLGGALLGSVVGGGLGEAVYYGSNMTANLVATKYGRDDERESDFLGIYALYKAGYHPHGMSTLFEKFGQLRTSQPTAMETWFGSHPQPGERVKNALQEEAKLPVRNTYLDRTAEYTRMKAALALQDKPWEIRDHPENFLAVTQPKFEYNGDAWVQITNQSDYTVSHVGVYINYLDRRGKSLNRAGVLVSEAPIPPGQNIRVNMGATISENSVGTADHIELEIGQAIPRPNSQ
jgi:beta-barrel assembly-enhancing protease